MAKFRVFNVQLLPNNDEISEVGRAGYRKLFSGLNALNRQHLREKTHPSFHYGLPADTYIGPKDFNFPSGYVYGYFVRYTQADDITELRTGRTLYRVPKRGEGVMGVTDIPFVFDTDRHFLAIDGSSLPKSEVFVDALMRFLSPVQESHFPDHELTVNLISKQNAIEKVFSTAVAYKVVDLQVSFPNGHSVDQLLQELKDSKTHQVAVRASGGAKGRMSKIPEFIKDLLRAASSHGRSRITYYIPQPGAIDGVTKKAVFDSQEAPLTFAARRSAHDSSDEEFFGRVAEKLDELKTDDISIDDDEIVPNDQEETP